MRYDQLYDSNNTVKQKLAKLFQEGIDKAVVKPLKRFVHQNVNIQTVIRRHHNKHALEKTLIQVQDQAEIVKHINSKIGDQIECDKNGVYIVFGDSVIDDFLYTIEWLILHRAKHIVACLSERPTGYLNRILSTFQQHYHVTIHTIHGCLNKNNYNDFLHKSSLIGPLRFLILINLSDADVIKNIDSALRSISLKPIMILLQCNADGISNTRNEDRLMTCNLSSERQRSFRFFNDILLILNDVLVAKNTDKVIIKKSFENEFQESQQMKLNGNLISTKLKAYERMHAFFRFHFEKRRKVEISSPLFFAIKIFNISTITG